MIATQLPLRDVHLPPAPGWWPPAPGWWLLAAMLVLALAVPALFWLRRRRRRQRWQALFASAIESAEGPSARLAAMSGLLRRAARQLDAEAATLQGEAWLHFLDGAERRDFSKGDGRLLLDGGFRRDADAEGVARAGELAQARFLELMAGRR